jgi:hypothetical protein
MLTYADEVVDLRKKFYRHVSKGPYADVCWRLLTYADVCRRVAVLDVSARLAHIRLLL